MNKEEFYGAVMGLITPGIAKAFGLINVSELLTGVLIAALGAFVGAIIGFITKRLLRKWFKVKDNF